MLLNLDYKHPNYTAVYRSRAENLAKLEANPVLLRAAKIHYKNNPWDFITDWGMTFDPRNIAKGLPAAVPFILWPKQIEWMQWVHQRWQNGEAGVVEKSRDWGVTSLATAYAAAMFLFWPGHTTGLGSRKEELIDKVGDPKTIFYKVRYILQTIPPMFLPKGWDEKKHCAFMRVVNPENEATITGEAGDQIGRGGRTSIYLVDEAQPLTSLILTPDGWETMADMRVGSIVTGPDGGRRRVTHINDAGTHPVYRLHFRDGTSAECSPHHLWAVDKVWGGRGRVTIRTHEIAESYIYRSPGGQTQYRYRLPQNSAIEFNSVGKLPLNPYLVGALIGDGTLSNTSVRYTSADEEVINRVRASVPDGYVVTKEARYDYRITHHGGRGVKLPGPRRALRDALLAIGLSGLRSHEKYIPAIYLMASIGDRLDLLRGLMDTDGCASGGRASYHTCSERLASDVLFLVRSLGGMATHSVKPDHRGYRDMYYIHVAMPDGVSPFSLNRKKAALSWRQHEFAKTITYVELLPSAPVRCITVDALDGQYITDGFAVTHNCAFIEHQDLVDGALSLNTDCQIDISTYNGNGNAFYKKAEKYRNTPQMFVCDWKDDPRKDMNWYMTQRSKFDENIVAQEIDRDPHASQTDSFIPAKWVAAAIDAHKTLGIRPTGIRATAFDPADVSDARAVVNRYGPIITAAETKKDGEMPEAIQWAYTLADDHRSDTFVYDGDGMGAPSMKVAMRTMSAGRMRVLAYHGSGGVSDPDGKIAVTRRHQVFAGSEGGLLNVDDVVKTNRDTYLNYRAQTWAWARARFEATFYAIQAAKAGQVVRGRDDELISIDSRCTCLHQLQAELSRPMRMRTGNGKYKCESKEQMRARGVSSPNLADALIIVMSVTGILISEEQEMPRSRINRFATIGPKDRAVGL